MKRRLWILNIALAVLLFWLGHVLRERWQDTKAHENGVLLKKVPPAPKPDVPARPLVKKLEPASYADVAMKMLFARDRSPEVIPPPPPQPPPPKPVPPFPVAHGVMIWSGVPPTIIFSTRGKADQQAYHAGEKVGEFQIASIDDRQVVFTWDGKTFVKNISDLEAPSDSDAAASQQQVQNMPPEGGPPAPPPPVQTGPGQNITEDGRTKTCDQNDPTPVGEVVDGYRKVAVANPMAPNAHFCQWQAVQ